MANWESKKINPNEINNGKQYNTYDGLSAEDVNNIVKGLLYAQEKTSDSQYVRIDDDIDSADKFIIYLNDYNINLTDFKNQTVCFESYSETDYYDYFVFLTNYDNEAILLCDGGVFNISYSSSGYKKYNIVQKVTGDLANLQTMDKDNLVSAINYTYDATLFNSRNIDTINQTIGSKFNLQTTDKTNLVNAINEINTISKANTNDINRLGLSLTDLKEALYGYVLDTQDVTITDIIPNQANGYNLVDNVRGLVKSINGNTIKVSGNNLISYVPTTLNSTNSVGDTIATITANGSVININRVATSGSNTQNNTIQLSKTLSANTQYTFKLFTQFEDTENFAIIFMNSSGQTLFQLNNSTNKQTYTPSSDITQVRVLTTSGTYIKDLKIMCIEGSTEPTEFESAESVLKSVEYQGLVVKGANLIDTTDYTLGGDIYNATIKFTKQLQVGKTYTLSFDTTISSNIVLTNATLVSASGYISRTYITFTSTDNNVVITFSGGSASNPLLNKLNNMVWFMLNYGSTVLDYVPYKEPQTLLQYPNTLRGVGTAKDKIVVVEVADNNYRLDLVRNIGEVDLGTLNWIKTTTNTSDKYRMYTEDLSSLIKPATSVVSIGNILCSKYTAGTAENTWNNINVIDVGPNAYIHVYDENYQDNVEFKTAMSGVMLQYELATPTTITIANNLTESQVMPLLELGGSIEANGGSATMEMVYKLINTATTSEVLSNE